MKTINRAKLEYVAHCAPKDDVRYYLNGVLIEASCMVATDSHRMAVAHDPSDVEEWDPVIIPGDIVKTVLKMTPKSQEVIPIESGKLGDISFTPIDGTYPDWRRVIPSKFSDELSQFDPKYVFEAHKASEKLHGKNNVNTVLRHNGVNGAMLYHVDHNDTFTIIMPRRTEEPTDINLTWCKQ